MTAAVEIDGLDVWFGDAHDEVVAVRGASFSVARGESFGLVGESGSGKSTILRAITGLAPQWSGRIAIEGKPLTGARRDRGFFRTVQMVFQDPYASLHPRHTVDRVLSETLALQGMDDIDARVRRLLDDVGLGPRFRFRYPHQLSGGQRQRVAIARALAGEPDILLLDEPTSALDVSVQAEILNLLTDLKTARGLTYLMVSHDLPVIGHMCDRLAVMRDGEIVELMDVATLRSMSAAHPYSRELLEASVSRAVSPG
jgi:peptide/nickel transport system ATP-binding protein